MFFFAGTGSAFAIPNEDSGSTTTKGFVFFLSHRAPGFAGPDHVAVAAVVVAAAAVAVTAIVAAAASLVELLEAPISDAPSPLTFFVTHFLARVSGIEPQPLPPSVTLLRCRFKVEEEADFSVFYTHTQVRTGLPRHSAIPTHPHTHSHTRAKERARRREKKVADPHFPSFPPEQF